MPNNADQDMRAAVHLKTYAEPVPWRDGQRCDHVVEVDNRRPGNLYDVEILCESVHQLLHLGNGIDVLLLSPVITARRLRQERVVITPLNRGSGMEDEIETTMSFYDATQASIRVRRGTKAQRKTRYDIEIP